MKLDRKSALVPIAAALLTAFSQSSYADFSWDLSTSINGDAPSGSAPWMTASFADTAADTVTMTLTNLMGSGQFISDVVFNSSVNPTLLTVTRLDSAPPAVNNFFTSATQDMVGGSEMKAGLFNMFIDFAPPPGNEVFNSANGAVIYKFTGTGLDSSDFMMQSAPGGSGYLGTTFFMAAKVQGIPTGEGSGSIGVTTPIPEPETYAMLLAGLGLMGLVARRRRRQFAA